MFLTLLEPNRRHSSILLKYLLRLVRKGVHPVLVLPKTSVSMEDGFKLGKLLSKIPTNELPLVLSFAETFEQAVSFCKEIKSGKLGSLRKVLPIFIDVTQLTGARGEEDLGEMIGSLGRDWEMAFPLTCFLEIGRNSSRLAEASGRTSLFEISSIVLTAGPAGWRRLKEETDPNFSGEWTTELLSALLPGKE